MKKGAKIAFPQLYIAVAQCGAFFNSVASYPLGNRLIHLAALCLVPVLGPLVTGVKPDLTCSTARTYEC